MNFSVVDFLEGARNLYRFFDVKKGQNVVLVPTAEFVDADPLTLQALLVAGKEIGAEVTICIVTKKRKGVREDPPDPVARAITAADFFLGMGIKAPNPITGHCRAALTARWDHGAKQADLAGDGAVLATDWAKFPPDLILAVGKVVLRTLMKSRTMKITSSQGTNLTAQYDPYLVGGSISVPIFEYGHILPGTRATVPLGVFILETGEKTAGTVALDALEGKPGVIEELMNWTVKDNRIVGIDGGFDSDAMRREMEGVENSNFIEKLVFGLNPKARIIGGLVDPTHHEAGRHSGVLKICLGDRPGGVGSPFHRNGEVLRPTVEVAGELLIENGKLKAFEDPEVLEAAKKFGNPTELLKEIA
jgi:hypothetical protein